MHYAEQYATPFDATLGTPFTRTNDFQERFELRWGRITFHVWSGNRDLNIKIILKVFRQDNTLEQFVIDTDLTAQQSWNYHQRVSRDFFIYPFSHKHGPANCVKFSYIIHDQERSIPSQKDYIFFDGGEFYNPSEQYRQLNEQYATLNHFRTHEVDAAVLQRDVDHYNHHFEALRLTPKFTKGLQSHPYHPKRYIHDMIDKVIAQKWAQPHLWQGIKVSVDCIDDNDFVSHLIYAATQGVSVQCLVDWRKMTLTHSENYVRLKRSPQIELLGIVCTPHHHLIEVAPDMHTKFIIFGDEDAIVGSFNITFDRWWANWESGMTFQSKGICRLLDNIFQSIRGGMIQAYGVDPSSHFNLLYTFGRQRLLNGQNYRPHHAIFSEINRARYSIRIVLFLINELQGDHGDSVIDALIRAHHRGVKVELILNGHLARVGRVGKERTMHEELHRPLLPAINRLKSADIPVALVYGQVDHPVPYSPIHAKYCIIDDYIILDGSFNWYNTSVFSHDQLIVVANSEIARHYRDEFYQILQAFRVF